MVVCFGAAPMQLKLAFAQAAEHAAANSLMCACHVPHAFMNPDQPCFCRSTAPVVHARALEVLKTIAAAKEQAPAARSRQQEHQQQLQQQQAVAQNGAATASGKDAMQAPTVQANAASDGHTVPANGCLESPASQQQQLESHIDTQPSGRSVSSQPAKGGAVRRLKPRALKPIAAIAGQSALLPPLQSAPAVVAAPSVLATAPVSVTGGQQQPSSHVGPLPSSKSTGSQGEMMNVPGALKPRVLKPIVAAAAQPALLLPVTGDSAASSKPVQPSGRSQQADTVQQSTPPQQTNFQQPSNGVQHADHQQQAEAPQHPSTTEQSNSQQPSTSVQQAHKDQASTGIQQAAGGDLRHGAAPAQGALAGPQLPGVPLAASSVFGGIGRQPQQPDSSVSSVLL